MSCVNVCEETYLPAGGPYDPILVMAVIQNSFVCCIVNGDIAANAICASEKLCACSICADQINTNAIVTRHLSANSVTADKIYVDCLSSVTINTGCLKVSGCIYSDGYASGALGQGFIMCCNGFAEFQDMKIRGEIISSAFKYEHISAIGGILLISKAGVLAADMGTGCCMCLNEPIGLVVNEVVRLKDGTNDEWLLVTCIADAPEYCVCRDLVGGGASPVCWKKGTAVASMGSGASGACTGYAVVDTVDAQSPFMDIVQRSGTAYDSYSTKTRLGKLDGIGGISGWGLYSDNAYLTGSLQSTNYDEGACGYCLGSDSVRIYGGGGEIVCVNIMTALTGERTIMGVAGFCAVSCDGNCCSYLSAGVLRFKTCYDDIPYPKRICSGTVEAGCTVILCRWETAPEIMLGIQELRSYDCTESGCQRWCIYADTPEAFNAGGDNFGYCFAVHAALLVEEAQCSSTPEAAFGDCFDSEDTTCEVTVCTKFNKWCYPGGDCCYYYGCVCYEVCYRVCTEEDTEDWCSCTYIYSQPHSNKTELQTDTYDCRTISFPCCECWQFMVCECATTYVITSICGNETCCCCRTVTPASNFVCAYACAPTSCGVQDECCTEDNMALSGDDPSNVYCTYACFCWCSVSTCYMRAGMSGFGGAGWGCATAWLCAFSSTIRCCTIFANSGSVCCVYDEAVCVDLSALNDCSWSAIDLHMCACASAMCLCGAAGMGCGCACNCVVNFCLIQCYCNADAQACCTLQCVDTLISRLGTQTTLDGGGTLSWFAVAYA